MRSTFHRLFYTVIISLFVQLNGMNQEVMDSEAMNEAYQSIGIGMSRSVEVSSRNTLTSQKHLRYEMAILERIERNEMAVFLFEELQIEVVIPIQILPANAQINTWFDVWVHSDGQIIFSMNEKKTIDKRDQARRLKDQLEIK